MGTANFFIFRWSQSVLQISDKASMMSSGEESQSTSLDDSNNLVEQCEQFVDRLQFAISYWWRILFLKYLFIDTYKATPSHLGLQSALLNHRLVLFPSHRYRLQFMTADQPGFDPWSPRTTSSYATIVLRSIDSWLKNLLDWENCVFRGLYKIFPWV